MFSRQWRLVLPASAPGLIQPDGARRTAVGMGGGGAVFYDWSKNAWAGAAAAGYPGIAIGEGAGIIYLEKRQALFVFGALGKPAAPATWLCDLTTNTWTDLKPATSPPGDRTGAMCYLPDQDAVFAGVFRSYEKRTFEGDEWAYSFADRTWRQVPTTAKLGDKWPLNVPPPAYHSAWDKLVYDPKHGVLLRPGWVMRPDLSRRAGDAAVAPAMP